MLDNGNDTVSAPFTFTGTDKKEISRVRIYPVLVIIYRVRDKIHADEKGGRTERTNVAQ